MKNINDMELPELYRRKKFLIRRKIPQLLEESNKLMKHILVLNDIQLGLFQTLSALESAGLADRDEKSIFCNKYYSDDHYGEPKEYVDEKTINSHYNKQPEPSKERQLEIMDIIRNIEQEQDDKKTNCLTISKEIEILADMQYAINQKLDGNQIQSNEENKDNVTSQITQDSSNNKSKLPSEEEH